MVLVSIIQYRTTYFAENTISDRVKYRSYFNWRPDFWKNLVGFIPFGLASLYQMAP